ncbi:hypothetical protein DL93DRAFT_2152384 [Clavulina sp. PMI_390]|nr:hypothetical protein DL93DRAFT_2152384 [Clavulina sp. PMI_390]
MVGRPGYGLETVGGGWKGIWGIEVSKLLSGIDRLGRGIGGSELPARDQASFHTALTFAQYAGPDLLVNGQLRPRQVSGMGEIVGVESHLANANLKLSNHLVDQGATRRKKYRLFHNTSWLFNPDSDSSFGLVFSPKVINTWPLSRSSAYSLPEDLLIYILRFSLTPKELVSLSQTCTMLRSALHDTPLFVWRNAWENSNEPLPPFPDPPRQLILPALPQTESNAFYYEPSILKTSAYSDEDMPHWWRPLSGAWSTVSEGIRCKAFYLRARQVQKNLGAAMPATSCLLVHSTLEEPHEFVRMALSSSGDIAVVWFSTGIKMWDLTLGFRYEIPLISRPLVKLTVCIDVFMVGEEYGVVLVGDFLLLLGAFLSGENRVDVLFQPLLSDWSGPNGAITAPPACRVLLSADIDPWAHLYRLQLSDRHVIITICQNLSGVTRAIVWVLDFIAGKQYAFGLPTFRRDFVEMQVVKDSLVIASDGSITVGTLCERTLYRGPSFASPNSLFSDPSSFTRFPKMQQYADISSLGDYLRVSIYRQRTTIDEGAFPGTIKIFGAGQRRDIANLWLDGGTSTVMYLHVRKSDTDEQNIHNFLTVSPASTLENVSHIVSTPIPKSMLFNPGGKSLIQSLGISNLSSPGATAPGATSHIFSLPTAGYHYTIECLAACCCDPGSGKWNGETNTLVVTKLTEDVTGQPTLQRSPLSVVDHVKKAEDVLSRTAKRKPRPMTQTGLFGRKFAVQWHEALGTMLSWNSTDKLFKIYQFL